MSRTAVSWEPLLHALPKDLGVRCASLRVEFQRQCDELFELYGQPGLSAGVPTGLPDRAADETTEDCGFRDDGKAAGASPIEIGRANETRAETEWWKAGLPARDSRPGGPWPGQPDHRAPREDRLGDPGSRRESPGFCPSRRLATR